MSATMAEPAPSETVPAITRVEWAPVARVNLLPPEIFEGRRFKRLQRLLGLAVVAAVALAAAGVWWSQQQVAAAEERLATAQSRTTVLQVRERAFAEVPRTLQQVKAAQEARARVMASDVLWYQYLTELTAAAPSGVTFEAITAKVSGPAADVAGAPAPGGVPGTAGAPAPGVAATATTDPLAPPGIGVLTIDGVAGTYRNVAAWLEAVDEINGLDASSLSSADLDDSEVTYASGVTITAEALSHRYDEKAG